MIRNKEYIRRIVLIGVVFLVINVLINGYQYRKYTVNYNKKINEIMGVVISKYPDVDSDLLIDLFNNSYYDKGDILARYGIDSSKYSIIRKNDDDYIVNLIINSGLILGVILLILVIFYYYDRTRDRDILKIVKSIEEINKKNYQIDIYEYKDSELSSLKSEIYKMMLSLKEMSENVKCDNERIKDLLIDITHQLKTPFTTIEIMVDNMLDNPRMDDDTRRQFLMEIKKEVLNVNFLVGSLLKASKLEVRQVKFKRENILVSELIEKAILKVDIIRDYNNKIIKVTNSEKVRIMVDERWEIEALSNILKNAIEYASREISVSYRDYKIFTEIRICDDGRGLSEKEVADIFKRFNYNDQNVDSIGIGLFLANKIIKIDNGEVVVESSLGKGVQFIIKYYRD